MRLGTLVAAMVSGVRSRMRIRALSNTSVDSSESLAGLSSTTSALVWLTLAAVCKLILCIVTFGIKVPCGLFVPSLAVGACAARAFAILL
jgi:chloride channel 3/4/5